MPSSLTEDRSSTLGSLPLPTCVGVRYGSCGLPPSPLRTRKLLEAFLGDLETTPLPGPQRPLQSARRTANAETRICLGLVPRTNTAPCPFGAGVLPVASPPRFCTRHARVQDSLTCSPSPTPPDNQRPRLRIRLTLGRLPLPRNPQASGVAGLSPPFSLLIPAFSLVGAPSGPSGPPSPLPTTLPYHGRLTSEDGRPSVASGGCLSPVTLSAQGHSTSELLRTLSRMAASKPTSWLSARPHYLSHSAAP